MKITIAIISNNFVKGVIGFAMLSSLFAVGAFAQGGSADTRTPPPAKKALSPKEELEAKLGKSTKTPPEFIVNLGELVSKYPYSNYIQSYLYSFDRTLKAVKDNKEARNLVFQLLKNTESAEKPLRGEIYRQGANTLFNRGFYEDAAKLAQQAIDLFDDAANLEFQKKQHDASMIDIAAKNPQFKPREFDTERMRGMYVGTKSDVYSLLAKILWEQGKYQQSEEAYRTSFAIKKNKNAAIGIARAAEKNGKPSDALEYAGTAVLTAGKLDTSMSDYFEKLYAAQHQGSTAGAEEYLDSLYRKTYINPIKGEKYKPSGKRGDRTVLAEFFTGAGCIPCIPSDYTFETALKDYSPKEMTLLVYHWYAPTWDPLDNYSSDSRIAYYDIKGAPTIVFDGKKSDKEGDYYGMAGEANEIPEIAKGLNEDLLAALRVPAEAKLSLKAKLDGRKVSVNVKADKIKNTSGDVSLQIALVENEVTYSGENGLRFQMKVVRALAGDNDKRTFGLKVDPTKTAEFQYVFDVDKIVAQNGSYYDTFKVEKEKEFAERFGGTIPEGLQVEFKYKRNQIDQHNLSVVAFLQDNKTKKVLQARAYNLAEK